MDIHGLNYTLAQDVNGPLLATALTLELTAALVINTIVLAATISQYKSLKIPSTILFTSLILVHYEMALLYMSSWLISAGAGSWVFGGTIEEKEATCNAAGFILKHSIMVINATLTAISVDRWLFITKPIFYKQYVKPKVAAIVVINIWVLTGLLSTTPFFGIGQYFFGSFGSCGSKFEDETVFTLLVLIVFLPEIGIIVVTSIWTYCFTKKFLDEQTHIDENNVYVSKKRRIVGIFGLMLIAYVICYLPSFVPIIQSQFQDAKASVFAVGLVFLLGMTIVNPIIQSFFRAEVKSEIGRFYKKIRCHKSNAVRPQRINVAPIINNNNNNNNNNNK